VDKGGRGVRAADEGTIARDLSELLLQLGRAAAEKRTGVVFLLDEVQCSDHARRRRPAADPEAHQGLVYATEEYGYVDFTVPRFGEFMVRYMPFRSPDWD
jgi:hypothetical protein